MAGRPTWVIGLDRLLAERRLQKKDLALLAADDAGRPMRPANISHVASGIVTPDIVTLQRLARGFTLWDRGGIEGVRNPKGDPNAPDVALWEFFVSDEESELLRTRAQQMRTVNIPAIAAQVKQHVIKEFGDVVDRVTEAVLTGTDNAPVTNAVTSRSNASAASATTRPPDIVTTTREHPRGTERIKRRSSA